MDRHEFKRWADDFHRRFPEAGEWLKKLSRETRDIWFDDVFSQFELSDAIHVNRTLMMDGELPAYDRERIPSIFFRRLQETRHRRETLSNRPVSPPRTHARQLIAQDVMSKMLASVDERASEWKKQNPGQRVPPELIEQWTAEASDEFDTADEQPWNEPAYRCPECRDKGLVSFVRDGISYVGKCRCDQSKMGAYRSGRELGYAPSGKAPLDNPFQHALNEES